MFWQPFTGSAIAKESEPSEYRLQDYRAVVPQTLQGAKVIDSVEALSEFIKNTDKPVLVDVYPASPKPVGLIGLWIEPKRYTIAKSMWLANVGMGLLPKNIEQMFQDQLQIVTSGDKNRAVLVFCEPECWHSWNAAKRAVSYGYTNVYWSRKGVSDWKKSGRPVVVKVPVRP